ncbi:MipA/OmpV family protein [Vibrio hippocampi]|nr:MipA/OmpV family protein [Vibrio hippocampi]
MILATELSEQEWGIAALWRTSSISFDTQGADTSVSTFIPTLYFQNDYVFIDGLTAGAHLYNSDDDIWQLNAIGRLRFVDIPKDEQNQNGGDSADFGLQLQYQMDQNWVAQAELLSDKGHRYHGNLRLLGEYELGALELKPNVTLRYKDADFNSQYYGQYNGVSESIGAGLDYSVGVEAKYHVYSNLYLLGETNLRMLDNNAYHASVIDQRFEGEVFVGFGFFNDKTKTKSRSQGISSKGPKPYVRVAHGWATPSNMNEIFSFNREKDPYNNQLTSVFYGHPLTDELFGLPLDIYLSPGIAHHWDSEVQSASTEFVTLLKAYYTFTWPVDFRLGVGNGVSYIDSVTYIEQTEMDEKEKRSNKFMNYIDISLDVSLASLTKSNRLENWWLGYSLHHRSSIFETASQYGRIKGGSNYNTVYLQYHF